MCTVFPTPGNGYIFYQLFTHHASCGICFPSPCLFPSPRADSAAFRSSFYRGIFSASLVKLAWVFPNLWTPRIIRYVAQTPALPFLRGLLNPGPALWFVTSASVSHKILFDFQTARRWKTVLFIGSSCAREFSSFIPCFHTSSVSTQKDILKFSKDICRIVSTVQYCDNSAVFQEVNSNCIISVAKSAENTQHGLTLALRLCYVSESKYIVQCACTQWYCFSWHSLLLLLCSAKYLLLSVLTVTLFYSIVVIACL